MQEIHRLEGLAYLEAPWVYPVKEDSLLLFREVLSMIRAGNGAFLDLGCGCGLNGLAAAAEGWEVLMVDREPRALSLARSNLALNGLMAEVCISDLLEGVNSRWAGRIDLAAFNPPYLETSGGLSEREGLPLSGRPTPIGLVKRSLHELAPFLKGGGEAIILAAREWDPGTLPSGTGLELRGWKELEDRSSGERFNAVIYSRPRSSL
ncbi:MAG: methyltransferase [Candidatus Thermoplasmatota archaeon]|nr:methyltransferase [Candidatus Thermoplasmatota archaeon]